MCRISVVFYAECGHIYTRATRCRVLYCQFLDHCHTIYSPHRLCPKCLSDLSNPCPSPSLVAARSRYFYRRGAREDLADQRQEANRERQLSRGLPLRGDTRPTYYLGNPFTARPELLKILETKTLPEDSSDCTICGGSYTDCALIGGHWDGKEFPVRLPCHKDHIFGVVCIMTWFKYNNSCPLCRCEFVIDRTLPKAGPPLVFRFLDGPTRMADLADPVLEDLDNEDLDGVVDDSPEGFEEVDGGLVGQEFIYEEEELEVEVVVAEASVIG